MLFSFDNCVLRCVFVVVVIFSELQAERWRSFLSLWTLQPTAVSHSHLRMRSSFSAGLANMSSWSESNPNSWSSTLRWGTNLYFLSFLHTKKSFGFVKFTPAHPQIAATVYEPQGITFLDTNVTFITNDLLPLVEKTVTDKMVRPLFSKVLS